MMSAAVHPNIAILQKLDIKNLNACSGLFSDSFVWHYFNSNWPEITGDYRGVAGLKEFFASFMERGSSTLQINPVDVRAIGDELVVVHACNRLALSDSEGGPIEFDAVVVWRIVNGQIAEAWDIPAINSVRPLRSGPT